ncbi:glycosyltransferase family 39 protein [Candidatus Gottesmanbacteria bacterium]|nr:glycosyltransferase family 39 protein [Candidatus Gottesmanbacteria bacterium]
MSTKWRYAIGLTVVYFFLHLIVSSHYGISWDYHYHHYAGLYHLGISVPSIGSPAPVPFSPPDPRLTVEDPFGPFTQIIPSLSQVLFYEKLHILPFDIAYNLPMILIGSLGVGLLYLMLYEWIGVVAAFFGSLFLALLPMHFGYLHTNMKDVPNAFFFTLGVFLFWKLVHINTLRNLFIASISFAVAFNTKINSIFIPVVCFFWLIISKKNEVLSFRNKRILLYFILAPVFALILWWPFWRDPLGKLLELPTFYSRNTLNMPVLFNREIIYSGVNIPWYYPFVYLVITTPIPILAAFFVGLVVSLKRFFGKNHIYSLILMWFFIPLVRYFLPKTSAIDGVRHFMEVIYPLSALSGIGISEVLKYLRLNRRVLICVWLLVFVILGTNVFRFHPYETSFYNWIIGGTYGAWGKFDVDFWGTPQKDAVSWLNTHAPIDSVVHIVMAQSSASMYLRPDLQRYVNSKNYKESDYTVILNKESFFAMYGLSAYLGEKTRKGTIVYEVARENVPLVWVIKN